MHEWCDIEIPNCVRGQQEMGLIYTLIQSIDREYDFWKSMAVYSH